MEALARVYTSFLEQYLSIETVNILLNAALQFNLEHLVERCEAFVLRHASQTFAQSSFEVLPEEEVCRLLNEDDLQIQEVDAFLAVLRWGKARHGSNLSQHQLKDRLSNLMQYIRFPMMDGRQLAETVEPTEVVEQWLLLECYRFRATGGEQVIFRYEQEGREEEEERRSLCVYHEVFLVVSISICILTTCALDLGDATLSSPRPLGGEQGGGIRSTANSPTGKSSRRFMPRRLGHHPELSMRAPSLAMPYRSGMSLGAPQAAAVQPPAAMVGVGLGALCVTVPPPGGY